MRDVVKKIFKNLHKKLHFQLLDSIMLEEVGRTNDPKYCLYHHSLGHTIEEYITFKN